MDEDTREIIEDTDADTRDDIEETVDRTGEVMGKLDEIMARLDSLDQSLARIESVQSDVIETGARIIEDEVADEIPKDFIEDSALAMALETVDDVNDILDSDKFDLSF